MNLLTVLRLIATLIYAALIGYCLHCLTLAVRHFTLHVRASRQWVMCRHEEENAWTLCLVMFCVGCLILVGLFLIGNE